MKARTAFLGMVLVVVAVSLGGCGPGAYRSGQSKSAAVPGTTVTPGSPLRILLGDQSDRSDPPSLPLQVLWGDRFDQSERSVSPRRILLSDAWQ